VSFPEVLKTKSSRENNDSSWKQALYNWIFRMRHHTHHTKHARSGRHNVYK
jgi:hypothetical protein